MVKTGFCQRDFKMANEQQRTLKENLISELLELFFTPQQKCNNISDFRLGAFLSSFVNKTYRVLLLQGGQIYCPTLLIPEMGKETFFKGCV